MPHRILVVTLNASGLDYNREYSRIRDALRRVPAGALELIPPVFGRSIPDLARDIQRERPDMVHIVGHGDDRVLHAFDEAGAGRELTAQHFGMLLEGLELELLYLSACRGLSTARTLAKYVRCAIAYDGDVEDMHASLVAGRFYENVAAGDTAAAALVRAAGAFAYRPGAASPVLLGDHDWRPVPPRRAQRQLRIVALLNGDAPYVPPIQQGFLEELKRLLPPEGVSVHEASITGHAEARHRAENAQAVAKARVVFGDARPDYVVPIGTAVAIAAVQQLSNADRVVFLGVSSPRQAGILEGAEDRPGLLAGVRYGLPIEDTIDVLRTCFPDRRPVFVCSGDEYEQDVHLRTELEALPDGHGVEVVDLESVGPIAAELRREAVFFGRYFLCSNMGDFVHANPDAAFAGVSPHNVERGAVMSIGYDTREIGRLGAREIVVPDVLYGATVPHGTVLEPRERVLLVSRRELQRCGLDFGSDPESVRWAD